MTETINITISNKPKTNDLDFKSFAKMNRFHDETMFISEKIDGTNAQILVYEEYIDNADGAYINPETFNNSTKTVKLKIGSRNRYIEVGDDNFGFAAWCKEHEEELMKLPLGRHYGEWWGQGIQRGYGMKEKKFSLFNPSLQAIKEIIPCIDFVPVLYQGPLDLNKIDEVLADLKLNGSKVNPLGFGDPEGVVVFLKKSNLFFKRTFDDKHKWEKNTV